MGLRKVRAWFEALEIRREQVEAAGAFAWVWADIANTDSYAYGASLGCEEAHALARLFLAFSYTNTAAELEADHASVCERQGPHAVLIPQQRQGV